MYLWKCGAPSSTAYDALKVRTIYQILTEKFASKPEEKLWSASYHSRFVSDEMAVFVFRTEGGVGPVAVMDALENKTFLAPTCNRTAYSCVHA